MSHLFDAQVRISSAGARALVILCVALLSQSAWSQELSPDAGTANNTTRPVISDVEEQLGARVPLEAEFTDHDGRRVTLGQVLNPNGPTVLSLVYYDCPILCSLVLNGLTKSLKEIGQTIGEDYQSVTLSIDPNDAPHVSRRRRHQQLKTLGQPDDAPWTFLTGDDPSVRAVADAVGFRYTYDPNTGQFAHPAVVMVLTREGRVSRYLYGTEPSPRDLNFALVEAKQGRVGITMERVLLSCFQYDPEAKGYTFYVFGFLRIVGVLTLLMLGAVIFLSWRHARRRAAGV